LNVGSSISGSYISKFQFRASAIVKILTVKNPKNLPGQDLNPIEKGIKASPDLGCPLGQR